MEDLKKYNAKEVRKARLKKIVKTSSFGLIILILFFLSKEIITIISQKPANYEGFMVKKGCENDNLCSITLLMPSLYKTNLQSRKKFVYSELGDGIDDIIGIQKIHFFLYDLIFNKKNTYAIYSIADSFIAVFLFDFFESDFWSKTGVPINNYVKDYGLWIKKDKITIVTNDLLFSSNLKLKSSDKRVGFIYEKELMQQLADKKSKFLYNGEEYSLAQVSAAASEVNLALEEYIKRFGIKRIDFPSNLRDTYPDLFKYINKSNNSFEEAIKIINNYITFAIPKYKKSLINDYIIETKQGDDKSKYGKKGIISNSYRPIFFEVEGIKNHFGEVYISSGDEWAKSMTNFKKIESNISYSDENRFNIKVSYTPRKSSEFFYLTNKFNNITTHQPIIRIQNDFIGPSVKMGYYILAPPFARDTDYQGSNHSYGYANIIVESWSGYYKPLKVKLGGDIERLYIDGTRFNFDPNKNPQEIFRRFPIESYIGFNKTKIVAYDKRNNKTIEYWEYDAK